MKNITLLYSKSKFDLTELISFSEFSAAVSFTQILSALFLLRNNFHFFIKVCYIISHSHLNYKQNLFSTLIHMSSLSITYTQIYIWLERKIQQGIKKTIVMTGGSYEFGIFRIGRY